jgi:hypothetical protein
MRTVRLKVCFEVFHQVPEEWDDESVLFHCNESSFCADNLLRDKLDQSKASGDCCCSPYDIELLPMEEE